jgi:hypothetical protein
MFDLSVDLTRGTLRLQKLEELYMVHLGEVNPRWDSILKAVQEECARRGGAFEPRVMTFVFPSELGTEPKLIWKHQPDNKWFLTPSCAINSQQNLFVPTNPNEVNMSLPCVRRMDQAIFEHLQNSKIHNIEHILTDPSQLTLQRVLIILLTVYSNYPKEITEKLKCKEVLSRLDQIWRLS